MSMSRKTCSCAYIEFGLADRRVKRSHQASIRSSRANDGLKKGSDFRAYSLVPQPALTSSR